MCRILILADIRPMGPGISFHVMVVFGLGRNLSFKSILGRCDTSDFYFSPRRVEIMNFVESTFLLKIKMAL